MKTKEKSSGDAAPDAFQRHRAAYHSDADLDWEQRAKINPLFAIMSDDAFLSSGAEPTPAELKKFYDRGEGIWSDHFAAGLSRLGGAAGAKILEFGCGMGRNLAPAARQGAICHGVDISPTQIELAKKYFPVGSAQFAVLAGDRIPWPDGHFDYVFTFAVMQHIKRTSVLRNALREMCRVLRPGGLLKVHMPSPVRYKLGSDAIRRFVGALNFEKSSLIFYWMKSVPVIIRPRWVKHTNLTGASFHHHSDKILSYLRQCGVHPSSIEFDARGYSFITGTKQA